MFPDNKVYIWGFIEFNGSITTCNVFLKLLFTEFFFSLKSFLEREANCASKSGSRKDSRSKTPVISTNQNFPFWATAKSPYSSPIPPRFASEINT